MASFGATTSSERDLWLESGITLLMEKGVFGRSENLRKLNFEGLRDFQNSDFDDARRRLELLMRTTTDRELNGEVPCDLHRYSETEFPSSIVRMIDDPKTLVQRLQRTGLCYLHAAVVVQYYTIWHNKLPLNLTEEHQMVDVTAYILKCFSAEALEKYVFEGQGGDSRVALENILQPGSIVSAFNSKDAPEMLAKYGPALVTTFKIHQSFMDETIHKHHAPTGGTLSKEPALGFHAMVLVGTHIDDQGKLFLLLQNWWLKKQFVEVDAEYFEACGGTLYFVKTPQTMVPDELPIHHGHFLQTEGFNMLQKTAPEWTK